MPRYDDSTAQCFVLTYKEGLMSAVAHDLKLQVTRWNIALDAEAATAVAEFDAGSLRLVNAMKDGRDHPGAFGLDAKTIEKNIAKDVLHTRRYPTVRFETDTVTPSERGYDVSGRLTLHGHTRALTVQVTRVDQRFEATVRLFQPDYGIKPYSAMFGALKIKPHVDVKISVPAD